jgi:hypothetical protein
VHFAWLVMWCVVDAGKRSEIGAREYIPSFVTFFFSCAVLGRCCRSIERLVAGEDEIWNLRFGITCILRLSARVSLPVRRYCQCHRPRLVDSYAAVV